MPCRDGRTEATYREDDGTCDYCGSLHPDVFMARLEAGDVSLEPTDKNYKVYVQSIGSGAMFKQAYGDGTGKIIVREMDRTKFYFEHLSEEQMRRFVELHNEKRLRLEYPGYFYRMPFFMGRAPAAKKEG